MNEKGAGGGNAQGGHAAGRGPSSYWMHRPEEVFEQLGPLEGRIFLDLGCGPGDYAVRASGLVGENGTVYALDRRPEMIGELRSKMEAQHIGNVKAEVADITLPLPLEDRAVDVCLLATVLHVPGLGKESEGLLRELRRVLKPGGRLAVIECKKEETPFGPPVHMRLSPEDIESMAEPCGFHRTALADLGNNYMLVLSAEDEA